jgi:ubiquinol-cytochrome c reductase cytochrome c1 subunit
MSRFKTTSLLAAVAALSIGAMASAGTVTAAEGHGPSIERQSWSFAGPFGQFDKAQLQRGFQVFREVCSACHALSRVAIRTLAEPGGPGFTEGQVKALAAEYKVKDINDAGEPIERNGRPADTFPKVFPNDEAAKAVHGAVPPDLSVIAKARSYSRGFPMFIIDMLPGSAYQEHGPDYIVALLNGYTKSGDDKWNAVFPGNTIGMAKPLSDGQVEYSDGSPKTVAQYSHDVAAFLMWAAEPKLEERKKTGLRVMLFLLVFAGLLYFTKKKVWADQPH